MRFRDEAKSGGETRNFVGFEGGREREREREEEDVVSSRIEEE